MDDTLQRLNDAIAETPADVRLLLERAERFFALRQYPECLQDCERILAIDDTNAAAYARAGHAYYRQNKFNLAFAAAEKALLHQPTCVLAYVVRGNVYADQLKDYDKALADYSKAIELDAAYAAAYNSTGFPPDGARRAA